MNATMASEVIELGIKRDETFIPVFLCGPKKVMFFLFGFQGEEYWPIRPNSNEMEELKVLAIRETEIGVKIGSLGEICFDRERKKEILESCVSF